MFKHKIKKLPVVKDGKLVGLVTFTDIARVQPTMAKTIRQLMEKYELPKRINKVIRYYVALNGPSSLTNNYPLSLKLIEKA